MRITAIFALLFSCMQCLAQDYAFVNGDPKFMDPNPGYDVNPRQDQYILKPDLPDGAYEIYYDAAKTKIFQKGFLKDGHRIKSWAYYTQEGKPRMEMEYDETGLISGVVREYYPSGALMTETQFKNGMANGILVSYYESGIKKLQCSMKDNNMHGKAIFYDESGQVRQVMDYNYGSE